ncbi:NAD(+) synthase [Lamprobacter modestohalophilus]|uniref:NAD(+) synthase n=1 Tax=Lamprobacter modestohalophilus TaxID=1064514 RepID=UPI002ADECBAA|nr:NAD(+) synthase [Lamprobacter modestohalophilus]MEA1052622.1 NAD(+) synthase [Lamprobacter modestohalophilus]
MSDFFNLYQQGLVRAAVCVPEVRISNPPANAEATIRLARRAHEAGALIALFPELGLTAYSNDDLFHQQTLLDSALAALAQVVEASRALRPLIAVGLPLRIDGRLFNCAVAIHAGRILGVTPKSYLPSYREFYEKRQFAAADALLSRNTELLGQEVPVGTDLLFAANTLPGLIIHMELCEDLWAPIPPSTYAAMAGATVLLNLSASNITIGKASYRNDLCAAQSGKCIAAYLYSAAGPGESTTDLAWDGHALIFEQDRLLAESERFPSAEQMISADIDLERLQQERLRATSFSDSIRAERERLQSMRRVRFSPELPSGDLGLQRAIARFPYVPAESAERDAQCYEAYNIQVHGLAQRLRATGIKRIVIGVSGGLDSTQALLVAARTMDRLGLPRGNILAYTLPGFATSRETRANALALMQALDTSAEEIDIRPSCRQMLADLHHPFADGEPVYDITFENVQAGERTSHLFRLANHHNALVLGTGDLSEIALGWSTYGVGDQMSHYNVNASVPKTLIQYLIRWVIASDQFEAHTNALLQAILDTEISPELVPADANWENADAKRASADAHAATADASTTSISAHQATMISGIRPNLKATVEAEAASAAQESTNRTEGRSAGRKPTVSGLQSTEAKIGPYELQDFNTYWISRYGLRPSKVAFLAWHAWHDKTRGLWPENLPEARRHQYDLAEIKRWLEVFLFRFFQISQFKRSCMPNGPKVGSGGSLSPRGDWRAPSDAEAKIWLQELRENVPDL